MSGIELSPAITTLPFDLKDADSYISVNLALWILPNDKNTRSMS